MNDRIMNALDEDPALRRRMEAFLQQHRPAIERSMLQSARLGCDIANLVGVLSDGQGPVPAMTELIPREVARSLTKSIKELWPELAEHLGRPRADKLPVLVFFEGQPGFGCFGVTAVRDIGAKA